MAKWCGSWVSGLVQGGTFATFTSLAGSTANQFVAGTVTLAAGVATGDSLSVGDLVPGDSFLAGLTVQNSGTLGLWYSMSTTVISGETLAGTLLLTVRTKTTNPCSNLDGTVLYGPGALNAAGFGQPGEGAQPGNRELAAGDGEELCFRVELPASTGPALQGNNATVTFTFAAVQQSPCGALLRAPHESACS